MKYLPQEYEKFLVELSELPEQEVYVISEIGLSRFGSKAFSFPAYSDVEVVKTLAKYDLYLRSASLRDSREAETLSISKDANRIASEALLIAKSEAASSRVEARWAKYAAIIAAIVAITPIIFAIYFK